MCCGCKAADGSCARFVNDEGGCNYRRGDRSPLRKAPRRTVNGRSPVVGCRSQEDGGVGVKDLAAVESIAQKRETRYPRSRVRGRRVFV